MFDLQKMVDAMGAAMRSERSNYHLTLGAFIEQLNLVSAETDVVFDDLTTSPCNEHSYRGYYADLCFERSHKILSAAAVLEMTRRAKEQTYEGYKGGDFSYNDDTPLWVAHYGDTGPAIVGAKVMGDRLVLITKDVD